MKKKVFLWTSEVENVLRRTDKIGGIAIQMYFWGKTFQQKGWDVFSFTNADESLSIEDINLIPYSKHKLLSLLHLIIINEYNESYNILRHIAPDVVIVRGADRSLYMLSSICKKLNIKLVYFSASDSDFHPGNEILTNKFNSFLYRKSIKHIPFIVTQNQFQADSLRNIYGKGSISIPNIWISEGNDNTDGKLYDAIWVANIKALKRPEWFVRLASAHPQFRFAMIGGPDDKNCYDKTRKDCEDINNIDFLGAQPFSIVNQLIEKSKILFCTSEFEGFPNTFLQAWSYNVPVISTVNPSQAITEHNLGLVVETEKELSYSFERMIKDASLYNSCVSSIGLYFSKFHSADIRYEDLIQFLYQ